MVRILVSALLAAGAIAAPVHACSFAWKPGSSPEELKRRADLRKVTGVFRVDSTTGETGADGMLTNGWIYGHIDTGRDTVILTFQDYHWIAADCGAYLKPVADAKGTFWLKRRRKDGRREIMVWQGTYLAQAEPQPAKEEGERTATP